MTVKEILEQYVGQIISMVVLVDEATNHRHVFHALKDVPIDYHNRVTTTSTANDSATGPGKVIWIYMSDQCSVKIDSPEFKTVKLVELTPETIDAIADAVVRKIRERDESKPTYLVEQVKVKKADPLPEMDELVRQVVDGFDWKEKQDE